MRIAVISTMFGQPWTGSEELWADMVDAALEEGHQVAISVSRWPEVQPQVAALQKKGARVLWRALPGRLPNLNRIFNRVVNRLTGRAVVLRQAKRFSGFYAVFRFRPDVIFLSQGWVYEFYDNPDLVSRLLACKIPLVVLNHQNMEGLVFPELRQSAVPFFERVTRLAFVSQRNLDITERHLARSLPDSVVVRNPVNMKDLSIVPWPQDEALQGEETWQFACVGRLHCDAKGQDVLLEALSDPVWRNRSWKLRFFGSGKDSEKDYIQALIAHYGLQEHVEFGGFVPDVRGIWADHHLLIMPSRYEGIPLAVVEAMLCGRPSVLTDVAGHTEWVEDGKSGFIAEAPTANSLRKALERAWNARHKWREMGAAAHEAACQRYDPTPGKTLLDIVKAAATMRSPLHFHPNHSKQTEENL